MQFKYMPLGGNRDEIRLISILPGKRDDPIHLEMLHTQLPMTNPPNEARVTSQDLNEVRKALPKGWEAHKTIDNDLIFWDDDENAYSYNPPALDLKIDLKRPQVPQQPPVSHYEALSYCWGATKSFGEIIAILSRGDTATQEAKYLEVGQSLSEALIYLRDPHKPRIMWIDAICINQNDIAERNNQVTRMGHVFSRASRVVAWIGPPSNHTNLAVSTLGYLGKQIENTQERFRLPRPGCDHPEWYSADSVLPYDHETWVAIAELLYRPWFKRLWVVQEIQLGSRSSIIQWGEQELEWSLFRRAVRCIFYKTRGVPTEVRAICESVIETCNNIQTSSVENLLWNHAVKECLDDRDRIYGLLNLLPPNLSSSIRVDYAKSALEVFENFTRVRINQLQRLEFFRFCGLDETSWVSWVPKLGPRRFAHIPNFNSFLASGVSAALTGTDIRGVLEVSAIHIGTIRTMDILNCKDFDDIVRYLNQIGFQTLETSTYHNGATLLETYLTLLTSGLLDERMPELGYPTLLELEKKIPRPKESDKPGHYADLPHYWEHLVTNWLKNTRIFHTAEGSIGSCHVSPETGDQICVLLGCLYPLILRETRHGCYRVVGECQVAGFMDGEAVLGPLPRPWRVTSRIDADGYSSPYYYNDETGIEVTQDPRLGDLSTEWESIDRARTADDPLAFAWYRNLKTGEEMNADPRLLPEALEERGVHAKTITLR
ncbi:heterokaryon incompatibility protein-domain-containing protein [Xylariales sp. PMI_506]|nr:heterokaryon incompatibility protein-domain-containing protein [Xylariales sp. PMI_506]